MTTDQKLRGLRKDIEVLKKDIAMMSITLGHHQIVLDKLITLEEKKADGYDERNIHRD